MVYKYMIGLGYTDEDIDMIIGSHQIFRYREDSLCEKIKGVFDMFLDMGYSNKDILKMTRLCPDIYTYSLDNLKRKVDYMISLGYDMEQFIDMTRRYPAIYSYSNDGIKRKIDDLISLGYSHEEVIKITVSLPSLYGLNIRNISEKKEFYDEIGIGDYLVLNPKQFMQSVDLSYARYMFYRSIGVEIDIKNCYMLFVSKKQFEKHYDKPKNELLQEYSYDEYLLGKGIIRKSRCN